MMINKHAILTGLISLSLTGIAFAQSSPVVENQPAQDLSVRDSFIRKLSDESNKNLIIQLDEISVTRLDGPAHQQDTLRAVIYLKNEWPEQARNFDLKKVALKKEDLGTFKHHRFPPEAVLTLRRTINVPVEQLLNVIQAEFAGYRHTTFEICTVVKSVDHYHSPITEHCTNLVSLLQQPAEGFADGRNPRAGNLFDLFETSAYFQMKGCMGVAEGNERLTCKDARPEAAGI